MAHVTDGDYDKKFCFFNVFSKLSAELSCQELSAFTDYELCQL